MSEDLKPPRVPSPRRLLLVSISNHSPFPVEPAPAWSRCPEGVFRWLARARRAGVWPAGADLAILCPRNGLLDPEAMVEPTKAAMTQEHAQSLRHLVHRQLHERLVARGYSELLVCVDEAWLPALRLTPAWLPDGLELRVAAGPATQRIALLRRWVVDVKAPSNSGHGHMPATVSDRPR